MNSILQFILNPIPETSIGFQTIDSKVKIFFSAILFVTLIIFFWAILIALINGFNLLISGKEVLNELLNSRTHDLLERHSKVMYILILTVLAPVYEELEFRLFLDRKRSSLIISTSLFIFFFFVPVWFLHFSDLIHSLGIFGIIFIFTNFLFHPKLVARLKKINFRFIFYFSVFMFGFVHIFNFKPITFTKIILSPVLVFPQLIGGIALGYVRIKNGIVWSFLLHAVLNSIGFLLSPL